MLVHNRIPGMAPLSDAQPGSPVRTVVGDIVKRFLRATKPPARVGAGMGAAILHRMLRVVLWVNMYVAAGGGMATLFAARILPLAMLAVIMVLAKGLWRAVLMPF